MPSCIGSEFVNERAAHVLQIEILIALLVLAAVSPQTWDTCLGYASIYSETSQEMPYFRSLTFSSIASDGHRRSGILMLSPRSLRCTGPINLVPWFFSNFHFFQKKWRLKSFIFSKKMKDHLSFFKKKWRIIFHFFQKNEGFLSFFPKKWRISFIFFKKMKETFSGSRIIGPVHRRLC